MKLAGKVKDFMVTKFPRTNADRPVCKIVGRIRGFMVVFSGSEIVGIVTEMDVLREIRKSKQPSRLTAKDCMSPCKVTGERACFQISEDRPADEALEVMTTGDVAQLLVFNKKKKIIGVISVDSLLKGIKACRLI